MRFWKKWGHNGQAAVETALVMPLNVFLLLGIIQYALISQARVLTKYAAYRAVRVGAMGHASKEQMTNAAMVTLLPIIPTSEKPIGGSYYFPKVNPSKPVKAAEQYAKDAVLNEAFKAILGTGMVSVQICGPLKSDVQNRDQQSLHSSGSSDEVDFDDPKANEETPGDDPASEPGYSQFMSTKLRIQVQFLYIMPIPFANWAISNAYLAEYTSKSLIDLEEQTHKAVETDQLLITSQTKAAPATEKDASGSDTNLPFKLWLLNTTMKVYAAPIVANYAMRMQSNFYLTDYPLPPKNACRHLAGE